MNNSEKNIKKIIHLMQTDDSMDAPADALKWSKNLFKSRLAEPNQSLIQRITAVLVRELKPGTALAGERSGSVGKARQMLFEAGENRIDLRVSTSGEEFNLRGQILGRGWEGSEVEFAGQKVSVNQFGGFVFKGANTGTYDVLIKGERIEIVLKGISLE